MHMRSASHPRSTVVLPGFSRAGCSGATHWHVMDAGPLLTVSAEGTCLTSSFPWWKSQAPSRKLLNFHQTRVSTVGMSEAILVIINPNRKLPCSITRSSRKVFLPKICPVWACPLSQLAPPPIPKKKGFDTKQYFNYNKKKMPAISWNILTVLLIQQWWAMIGWTPPLP